MLLLVFGIYKSVTLFGAYPVPNPDFPGFVSIGQKLLDFEIPKNFKRAPLVGMLQVGLSNFIDDDQPMLTAGWLLNAILCVFNVILVWLVGKKIIGNSAIWLAIVAMLNPWVLRSQVNPIAETTMIFFMLISLFFIFRCSNWAYVFASIASMVRYECVILIFIALLMDLIKRKTKKERLLALLWSFIALVPFLLWMLGTYMYWETSRGTHYLRNYGHGMIGMGFIELLWQAVFMVLFQLPTAVKAMFVRPATHEEAAALAGFIKILYVSSRITAVLGCLVAVVYGLCKRNWNLLALLLFLSLYIFAHATRPASHHRYCVPISWITLLVAWYGLQSCWKLLNKNNRIPKSFSLVLQLIIFIIVFIWLIGLIPFLSRMAPHCVKAAWLPYAAIGTVTLILILRFCLFKFKNWSGNLVLATLICLMVVSQHFMTGRIINNGAYYLEFRHLLDWYKTSAKPGEKLATRWTSVLHHMSVSRKSDLISIKSLKSDTFSGFVQNCHRKNITYIAWSARGSKKTKVGIENLHPVLGTAESNSSLKFIKQIRVGKNQINIFRLRRLSFPPWQ